MRTRILPLLLLLASLFSCGSSSKQDGLGSPIIYDFHPGRANLNPGTSTLLLANFVGGTATVDQGIGAIISGVPIPVSPTVSTVYTLTVKGATGDPAVATTTITVGPMSVDITPAQISLVIGQAQPFAATVTGLTDRRIQWSAEGGTIDSQGVYTAGGTPGAYLISAQSLAEPTLCAKAFVTVLSAPIVISVNPPTPIVTSGRTITLTAQVTGTLNNAVTWTTSAGTITPGGVLTAPAATGPITVTATSVADPTKSASTTVNVIAAPVASGLALAKGTLTTGSGTTITPTFASGTATIGTNGPGSNNVTAAAVSGVAVPTGPLTATTTFTLTVTNPAGDTATAASTATVVPVATASLNPSTATPPFGATNVSLTPTFTGGTAVVGTSQGASDVSASATSGTALSVQATGFKNATTYWIRVTNPAGDVVDASTTLTPQTVVVGALSPGTPTRTVGTSTVFSSTVTGGFLGTVTWSSTAGTWVGSTWTAPAAPGSTTITATSVDDPTKSATTVVTVVAAPVAASLVAAKGTITTATATTVTPTFANGTAKIGTTGPGSSNLTAAATSGVAINTGALAATTTFTLTVTNAAGDTATTTATITVVAAPVAGALVATKGTVTTGSSTTLTPTFSNGTATIGTTGPGSSNISASATSGTAVATGLLSSNTTYTLTVTNAAGDTATANVTVTVVAAPVATSLVAASGTVTAGTGTTVTPTFSNGTATIGTTGPGSSNITASATSGTAVATGNLATNTTFTMTVTNAAGDTATVATTITVVGGPTISGFTSNVCSVISGNAVNLTPTFSNGTATIGTSGPGSSDISASAISGTPIATPALTTATTFTLTVTSALSVSVSQTVTVQVQGFALDDTLGIARQYAAAAALPDGRALVVGGDAGGNGIRQTEVYDPTTGLFTNNALLAVGRTRCTATTLNNGTVLVAGGLPGPASGALSANVVIDPSSGSLLTAPAPSGTGRFGHTATLLPNGKVLLAGGWTLYLMGSNVSNCELYTPSYLPTPNNTVVATTNLTTPRALHAAVLLPDGRVMVIGGVDGNGTSLLTTEIYDSTSGTWSAGPNLNTARKGATATLLKDGRVLVSGGNDGSVDLQTGEILDARVTAFSPIGAPMVTARSSHQATLLASGQVLITGGSAPTSVAEVFDPTALAFNATGAQQEARSNSATALLPDGRILLIAGQNTIAPYYSQTSESFTPGSCTTSVLIQPLAASWWVGTTAPYVAIVDTPSSTKTVTWSTTAGSVTAGSITPGTGNGVSWTTPAASGTSNLIATANSDGATGSLQITSGPVVVTASLGTKTIAGINWTLSPRSASVTGALDPTIIWSTTEAGPASSHFGSNADGVWYTTGAVGGLYTVTATSNAASNAFASIPITVLNPPTIQTFTLTEGASPSLSWSYTPDPHGVYTASITDATGATITNPITPSGTFLLSTVSDGYTLVVQDQLAPSPQSATAYAAKAAFTFSTNILSGSVTVGYLTGLSISTVEGGITGGPYGATWTVLETTPGSSFSVTSGTSTVYSPPNIAGTYHVVATSILNPAKTVAVTVTVLPYLTLMPSAQTTTDNGRVIVRHVLAGAANTAVTWSITPPAGTANAATIDSNGVVTVPATAVLHGAYTVKAISVAFPSVFATVTVNVSQNALAPVPRTYGNAAATTNEPTTPRFGHATVLLADGRVLITGGSTSQGGNANILAAEIYDPTTGRWSATTGVTTWYRKNHTATLLPDGRVLLVGGTDSSGYTLSGSEVYDPVAGTFTTGPYMSMARFGHTAVLLPNGHVLVAGGYGGPSYLSNAPLNESEIFEEYNYISGPAYQGTWIAYNITGTMQNARVRHAMVPLLDGTVLAIGGSADGTNPIATVDRFTPSSTDPTAGAWTVEANLQEALADVSAALLPNGNLLLAGGTNATGVTSHLETFDATLKSFSLPGSPTLSVARRNVISLLGADGLVHLLGGWNGSTFTATHDVFNPTAGTLGAGTSGLLAARENGVNGQSTLLLDGSLFTVGYDTQASPPGNASETIPFQ